MRAKVPHSAGSSAIPKNWEAAPLGVLAERFFTGGTPSTKDALLWQGDIPWITSKWLDENLYLTSGEKCISRDAIEKSATSVVPSNSLIFATRVGVGKVSINKIDLAINQDLAGIVIPAGKVSLPFIAYQLRSDRIQKEIELHKRGATIKGITRDSLKELELWLPPLPEQWNIASVLSLVQRAIEQQERLIALATELKKSLMHKLFTEGLRGERQKQTEIGPVPESWEVMQFEEFALLQRGYDLPKSEFQAGSIPVVGATSIIGFHNISNVEGPGVTVVRSGSSVGKPLFIETDFWAHNVVLFVKDFHGHNQKFVYYKIQNIDLTKYREGVAVPTLNRNSFRTILVAVPKREEQDEFVRILDCIEQKELHATHKKRLLEDLFRTLLHQLMTAQIRVHDLDLSFLEQETIAS